MIDRDKFIAETRASIDTAALMLAGTDPRCQQRWLRARSCELRRAWRKRFETLTGAQVDTMVDNTMKRVIEKRGQLEARGVGMA